MEIYFYFLLWRWKDNPNLRFFILYYGDWKVNRFFILIFIRKMGKLIEFIFLSLSFLLTLQRWEFFFFHYEDEKMEIYFFILIFVTKMGKNVEIYSFYSDFYYANGRKWRIFILIFVTNTEKLMEIFCYEYGESKRSLIFLLFLLRSREINGNLFFHCYSYSHFCYAHGEINGN